MSTKVTLHVCNEDMDYAHSIWDAADLALQVVNNVLKEKGVDIQFNLDNHGYAQDVPDEFCGENQEWIEVKEE